MIGAHDRGGHRRRPRHGPTLSVRRACGARRQRGGRRERPSSWTGLVDRGRRPVVPARAPSQRAPTTTTTTTRAADRGTLRLSGGRSASSRGSRIPVERAYRPPDTAGRRPASTTGGRANACRSGSGAGIAAGTGRATRTALPERSRCRNPAPTRWHRAAAAATAIGGPAHGAATATIGTTPQVLDGHAPSPGPSGATATTAFAVSVSRDSRTQLAPAPCRTGNRPSGGAGAVTGTRPIPRSRQHRSAAHPGAGCVAPPRWRSSQPPAPCVDTGDARSHAAARTGPTTTHPPFHRQPGGTDHRNHLAGRGGHSASRRRSGPGRSRRQRRWRTSRDSAASPRRHHRQPRRFDATTRPTGRRPGCNSVGVRETLSAGPGPRSPS